MEWEAELRTRYVGLLTNVLVYRFRSDIPTKRAAYERTVHDYENQSTKTVDDDIKISDDAGNGGHASTSGAASGSQAGIRCERRFSRSRERNSTSTANRCQCNSERIRRAKARTKTAKAKAKVSRSEKMFLLPKDRPREGRVQKATGRPCRCRGETGGSVATSTRHSSGRADAVLTPRRETLVNGCHSHALCEQRNVLRVFK